MNESKEIKIIKSGYLKYDKLKSISILRHELTAFGFNYPIKEVRDILELILNNLFTEPFDRKFQHCVDSVFFDNIYENISENNLYDNDCCFPENYIMPTAP